MVEVEAVEGPLDERKLGWVARLYGAVDPKYRDEAFLRHMFVRGPSGAALHAFATDAGEPVGHAAVVRMPAQGAHGPLLVGKLEALVVDERHRGARGDGPPVVRRVLDALYALSDARGFDVLHAYVLPAVGRVIGFDRLEDVGPPSLVTLVRARRGSAERALLAAQTTTRAVASALGRAPANLRPVSARDADLVSAPVRGDAWRVDGDAMLEWYTRAPHVRVLDAGGSRGLVQVPASSHEPLRVAAWAAPAPTVRTAVRFLVAAARVADSTGTATLRLQPAEHPSLRRAARLLGFVRRWDLTTLWVRTHDPALARREAVVWTPSLYLGF